MARLPTRLGFWQMVDLLTTYRVLLQLICMKRKPYHCPPSLHISVLLTILVLIFGRVMFFRLLLGFMALG